MRAVASLGARVGLYPRILAEFDNGFDMEYIDGISSAERASNPEAALSPTLEVRQHYRLLAGLPRLDATAHPAVGKQITYHAHLRCGRWLAPDAPTSGREFFTSASAGWIETAHELEQLLAPPFLNTAAHADLVPANIIWPGHKARGLVYLDPRGKDLLWVDNVPYWDATMDVCSFLVFLFVVPQADARPPAVTARHLHEAIADLIDASCDSRTDPMYYHRLLFYIALRYLGYAWILAVQDPEHHRIDLEILRERITLIEPLRYRLAVMDQSSAALAVCDQLGPQSAR